MLKRFFDICVSGPALVVLSPLLVGLAVAIKVSSPGPVFYRGLRGGRYGKPFRIFKYRSMVINADRIGGSSTSDRDPRITRVGQFIRKYKLDELPQLINVLLGDMSLVGPRPQVCSYVEQYDERERDVLKIRPGISDWASIWNSDEGAVLAAYDDPDAAYDRLIHPTKMKLQLKYADKHNLLIDLKIIFSTLRTMIQPRWLPAELADVPRLLPDNHADTLRFETVTELPGAGATRDQLSMLHTRYAWAAEFARDKEVLEVACGSGIGLNCLESVASRVVGGDYDDHLVATSQMSANSSIDVQRMDAQELPFDDASFDVVILLEALYYIPDASKFVSEAKRVLRPGGVLLVNVANCDRPDFNRSPFSQRYFGAPDLKQLLADAGMRVELFAAFPIEPTRGLRRLRQGIREVAVKLNLIPKTMRWKAVLKRIFFGKLQPLPTSLVLDHEQVQPLHPITGSEQVKNYMVLYAVGYRPAQEQSIAA